MVRCHQWTRRATAILAAVCQAAGAARGLDTEADLDFHRLLGNDSHDLLKLQVLHLIIIKLAPTELAGHEDVRLDHRDL